MKTKSIFNILIDVTLTLLLIIVCYIGLTTKSSSEFILTLKFISMLIVGILWTKFGPLSKSIDKVFSELFNN